MVKQGILDKSGKSWFPEYLWETSYSSLKCNIHVKKARLSAVFVFILWKKTGFSMVHYSVNQAIMTKKKVSLKYKILCLWSMTSTIHTSHLEYMYIQVVLYLLFRLQSGCSKFHHWKWTTNFKGFILHVFSLDKLQWNEKKLIFKIKADVYFSYSNSKWAVHKSSKRRLKMLCFKTKKNVNLIFDHVLLLLQPYILSIL